MPASALRAQGRQRAFQAAQVEGLFRHRDNLYLHGEFFKGGARVAHSGTLQRIGRLTPLGDVLPVIDALAKPVAERQMALLEALGRVLAEDVIAPSGRPPRAIAIRDGWAVKAMDTADASSLAPVPLTREAAWLETGDPLPDGADAVALDDAIVWQGAIAEAIAPLAPGDGMLPAGGDASAGSVLKLAGTRLRGSDLAVLAAAGIDQVKVRVPRISLVRMGPDSPIIDAAMQFVATAIEAKGGTVNDDEGAEALITIGSTGAGRRDRNVHALARSGRVVVHGVAISPGETAALGELDAPMLLIPGRLDAAISVWLLLGQRLLARLSGCREEDEGCEYTLARKVSSSLGLAEVIPVRRTGDTVEPLASGYLSLAALAAADGWILVPPDSEGWPAGARITVRPLP
jgi:molybdopterin biosynthesis enzyme